jgi:hypothetical protein
MSRFTSALLALSLNLTGCASDFTITKTELGTDTCTFTVHFPEDYVGAERGTQVLKVNPLTPRELALEHTKRPYYTVGHALRKRCAGYIAVEAPAPTGQ